GDRGPARDHALVAGTCAAPPRVPRLGAGTAAADRTGDSAVPHDRRGLRPAHRDAADRGAVRAGLLRPAAVAQDRAQPDVVAGVRGPAVRPLALRLARREGGALDI